MAIYTKGIMTERIRRLISGGFPSDRDRVQDAEISLAIADVINSLLKTEVYNTNYGFDGDSVIEGCVIATYEHNAVTRGPNYKDKKTALVALPATPMFLPDGQGVFSVYPEAMPGYEYIPMPTGMYNIWMDNRLVNPINSNFYSRDSRNITIYDDLVGAGINYVDLKMCIMDISQYGDTDPLPLPPEMAESVIDSVAKRFLSEPDTTRQESNQPSPSNKN